MAGNREADVDRLTEALYEGPLARFVTERARLIAERRAAGDRAGAAAIAKAGKPTVSAWVTNQLARRDRGALQRLAQATGRVRKLQLAAGGREDFTAAVAAQREALAALRAAAERILVEDGHAATPSVLERVTHNLRAMGASEEVARTIEAGRLVRDPPVDLTLAWLSSAQANARKPEVKKAASERAQRDREIARRQKAVDAARARAREAADVAAQARREADRAEAAAKRAEAAAEAARKALEAAELEAGRQ